MPPAPPPWNVRLLGAVQVWREGHAPLRLPSRAATLLLARLALAPHRAHPREELVELLWPGVDLAVGRNRLRQTLSTLKRLLEAGGPPLLLADRLALRVQPGALACDVPRLEAALRAGQPVEPLAREGGDFMPGYYDEWVHDERQRLAALLERAPPAPAPQAPPEPALPAYLTRLFGAADAAGQLRAAVLGHRLVTLLGPGGAGKTRLAVEAARHLAAEARWRVVFVPLVACDSLGAFWSALAHALQLPGRDDGDDLRRIGQGLARQPTLLVLDNFEQLVGQAQDAVAALLAQVPPLHVLATSRRVLGLDGELTQPMAPLPLPAEGTPPEQLATCAAVALFVDRARLVRPGFELTPGNAAAVAALVRALHGLPLALELAASRVRSLAPAQLQQWLAGGQLALLARDGPRAGHDSRHASMEQVIAWSWRLLRPAAQRLLGAAACLDGAASVPALAAQLQAPLAEVAALLDELAGHSLVHPVPGGTDAAPQHTLLEPVREFVLARLAPAQRSAWRLAGRQHLLQWAQAQALGPAAPAAELALHMPALHMALAQAAEHPQLSLELALALRPHWDADGLPVRLQQALAEALPGAPPPLASAVHEMLAHQRFGSGFVAEATAHADAALALAGAEPGLRAMALVRRAWVDIASGRSLAAAPAARTALNGTLAEALALARAAGHREAEARVLHQQAALLVQQPGHHDAADALLAQSQALWQALGDRRKAMARLRNRAQGWVAVGRLAEARLALERCDRAARDDGDWVGRIDTLVSLSPLLARQRLWAQALAADQACIALCWQRWHRHGLAFALWNPPLPLLRLRRPEAAVRLLAFASRFWQAHFGPQAPLDHPTERRVRRLAQAMCGAEQVAAWWASGQAMELAEAVALVQEQPTS